MVNSILESFITIWDYWNIEGVILLSLSLQIVLLLFAPLRKRTSNKFVILTIWLAYLLADWVAGFGFGLITERARHTTDPSVRGIENTEILSFWAVFLQLHLGGPDTITAFSLEDNELWLRHCFGFVIQIVATVYIFLQTLPGNKLLIPTILVFVAGFIKYFERILTLYLASMDRVQESTHREILKMEELGYKINADGDNLVFGCRYFKFFRGILVDLFPSFDYVIRNVPSFCARFSPADALEIMEVELNLAYEFLHTKVKVTHSVLGIVLRFICFGSVVAALSIFHFKVEKQGFHEFDVGVTYNLFLGAIALDILTFFMLVPSDWTFAVLQSGDEQQSRLGKLKNRIASILHWITILKSPRWDFQGSGKDGVLATNFMLRRWSGSVSGLSLIRYMVKLRASRVHKIKNCLHFGFEKIIHHLRLDRQIPGLAINGFICSSGICKIFQKIAIATNVIIAPLRFIIKKAIDLYCLGDIRIRIKTSLLHKPLPRELWQLIFDEIKRKASYVDDLEADDALKIFSARGDWTLRELDSNIALQDMLRSFLGITDQLYYSTLLWHFVTELLYYTAEKDSSDYKTQNARESSKVLSEYMFYLLQSKPTLLHYPPTFVKFIFLNAYDYAKIPSEGETLSRNPEKFLCEKIIMEESSVMRLLSHGQEIAKELQKLEEDKKWELVSKVWVEKLSYAAIHCSKREHVKQVSNGGELITFVWLLLHHFGLASPKFTD